MLWLEHGLSDNTQAAYRRDIEHFLRWLQREDHDARLQSVSQQDIFGFLAYRLESGSKATSSARSLSSLKRFYRYLLRENLIDADPTSNVDSPKLGRKLPKTLSTSEVEALLGAPDLSTSLGLRDYAMIDLMYSSGLRVSELVSLRLHQFYPDRGFIRVLGKGQKERLVPMARATVDSINLYLQQGRPELLTGNLTEDVLFPSLRGKEMTRQTFWHRIKAYAEQSDIHHSLSPHTLRHAFATHLVNNGADLRVVQMLLGHSSLTTTQIYTYVAQERMKSLHSVHHPRA